MLLIWRFFVRLVPAGLPLSKRERNDIVRWTARAWMRRSRTGWTLQGSYVLIMLPAMFAMPFVSAKVPGTIRFGFFFLIVLLWFSALIVIMRNWSFPQHLYAELRTQGHNVCPNCGYHRQGLEDTAPCPECATVPPSGG